MRLTKFFVLQTDGYNVDMTTGVRGSTLIMVEMSLMIQ